METTEQHFMGITVPAVKQEMATALQAKLNGKTKPPGALGALEEVAHQIGLVQNTLTPSLANPAMLVMAADHGVALSGVSAYPQEVTWQMVMNFLQGGAAINVFARQHGLHLQVVDAGVNYDFDGVDGLVDCKVGMGTRNFTEEPAMSLRDLRTAIDKGARLVRELRAAGTRVVGFGEMGIGNTSSAAVLLHLLAGVPLADCVGRGTGLDDEGVARKLDILGKAVALHGINGDAVEEVLVTFGGFEVAMMVGGMLQAVSCGMVVLVDGFIAGAAALAAVKACPVAQDYMVFTHQGAEAGHRHMLKAMNARPLLQLDLRLGEGTGAALAFPLLVSAVNMLNEMASFEGAGVSGPA